MQARKLLSIKCPKIDFRLPCVCLDLKPKSISELFIDQTVYVDGQAVEIVLLNGEPKKPSLAIKVRMERGINGFVGLDDISLRSPNARPKLISIMIMEPGIIYKRWDFEEDTRYRIFEDEFQYYHKEAWKKAKFGVNMNAKEYYEDETF